MTGGIPYQEVGTLWLGKRCRWDLFQQWRLLLLGHSRAEDHSFFLKQQISFAKSATPGLLGQWEPTLCTAISYFFLIFSLFFHFFS